MMKSVKVIFSIGMAIGIASLSYGESNKEMLPSLKDFGKKVEALVLKYYPWAKVTVSEDKIDFEYGTREFMVHDLRKTGQWADSASPMKGPKSVIFTTKGGKKKSGIVGSIKILPRRYLGSITRPQTWDRLYFKELLLAPESREHDCFLLVDLRYPYTVDKNFLEEFTDLVNGYAEHLNR